MKQKIKTIPNRTRILLSTGIMMLLASPFIKPLYLAVARSGCPQYGERRLCGFEVGLETGISALVWSIIWLIVAIIVLTVGIVHYRQQRKKS